MIIYSMIVRTSDGMALTANTDFNDESNSEIRDNKRYVKLVAKKALQFPDRCSLALGAFVIHFISAAGLSFLALCATSYPTVLAFSFLSELQREFIVKYDRLAVGQARRPYSFIEFDSVIHAARQRYNKPQSLSTRIDLSRLSEEIRLRPPQLIPLSQVEPVTMNGMYAPSLVAKISVGPPARLEPVSWLAVLAALLSAGLAMIGAYRGVSSLASLDELDGPAVHGLLFLGESAAKAAQLYLLSRHSRYRTLESWLVLAAALACCALLVELRDSWQVVFYSATAIALHVCILRRRLELKLPNYNV